MSKQDFDEKDEKELQKREEKSAEEKWRNDPLSAAIWGLLFIWGGVVFLLDNLGYLATADAFLDRLGRQTPDLPFAVPFMRFEAWSLILVGGGLLLLLEVAIRLLVPAYRRPILGTLILAIVFLGLGLNNFGLIWPFIIIAVGVGILIDGLRRRR